MTNLQELRVDLACALRWAVRYDLHEGFATISRSPSPMTTGWCAAICS